MKHTKIAVTLMLAALVAAGCSGRNNTDEPTETATSTSARPSIAVSVKPAPEQPRNSRSPVKYDPCFEIGDDTITKAGFAPKTRERIDQIHDGYAFIGCTFERQEDVYGKTGGVGSLTISSTNVTLDEFLKREGNAATEIKVNGRDAITYRTPEAEACNVVMTGPDATINMAVSSTLALTHWNACDHAQEIAAIVESGLPTK
ncbi:DUF3558 domain-containing protein [Nocardia pseudovaccinii]|uniref:DUF3558 domain-containing protein n=1 Tax=Nocardia pseudovaccinii TaxID=189540 RepID=UPI003D900DF1